MPCIIASGKKQLKISFIDGGNEFRRRVVFAKHMLNNWSTHEGSRVRKVCGRAMGTGWRRYDFTSERRQQRLKGIQGYEWVLIVSWLCVLVLWGFTWWAAFRLLCSMVQFVQYVPRLLP
jgi:hypothetical protein